MLGAARPRAPPRRSGLDAVPESPGPRGIIAAGFVHADTVLLGSLDALIVIEHGTRRVPLVGITARIRRKQVLGGLTREYYIAA